MFQVGHTVISDDLATFRFACDLQRCKGGCCVIGEAGAPVTHNEIPVLGKAWNQLKDELRPRAREVVGADGLIRNGYRAPELNCTDGADCVFVTYEDDGVAVCAIQRAWNEGKFDWIKPLSCHLFPVRVIKVGEREYLNVEYVPSLCSTGCERGCKDDIYLSDFLEDALIRAYGREWYREFQETCIKVREKIGVSL